MRTLAIAALILFVLLPTDAQYWVLGMLRGLWLTTMGRAVLVGIIAGCATGLVWYSLGWNALAAHLHNEDRGRADAAYRSRRR